MNHIKKNPLGRGLESLIPKSVSAGEQSAPSADRGRLIDIDIADIIPNDQQPRTDFDPEAMEALTESVKSKGIMQPLVVTLVSGGNYMLIAGERRWRAAGLAGLRTVPAVAIQYPEENDRLELALIENTQRDDLKPMELAKAYQTLMQKCAYRQEDLAKVAGKSRSAVANTLRLLDLEPSVAEALENKQITEGHARVFLTLDKENVPVLLNAVLHKNLSVRETEALAKRLQSGEAVKKLAQDPDTEALEQEIERFFGSKVSLKTGKKNGGVIEIRYNSADELDKIVNKLRGEMC